MDKYLFPKEAKLPRSAPVRAAEAAKESGSARSKRPTASAAKHLAKKSKPNALALLRGPELNGRKNGLSLAPQKGLLSGPPSNKRQSLGSAVLQQRITENSTPTTQEQEEPAVFSGAKRRSHTDKIRAKRPLAAAVCDTAQKAGWYDMPGDIKARRRTPAPEQQQVAARPTTKVAPPRLLPPPAPAASAPSPPPSTTGVAPPPQLLPPGATSGTPREERPPAQHQQGTAEKKGAARSSRAGRMDEFFPRRTASLPTRPPPPPVIPAPLRQSSLPGGWVKQYARPPAASRRRSQNYDCDYVNSEDEECDYYGMGRSWDPDADHLRWRGDTDEEEGEEEEEQEEVSVGAHRVDGNSARGLSAGVDNRSGRPAAPAPAGAGSGTGSTGAPASVPAGVAARSTARSETAARAAAAAERRAATSATAGVGEGQGPEATRTTEVTPDGEPGAADQMAPATVAAASGASPGGPQAPEEHEAHAAETDGARGAAGEEAPAPAAAAVAWPCRRKRGSASLFLSQRQRTGGLRGRGVGVGDAGRDTFRRHALSTVLANGLRTQRLRLGRARSSRVGVGVVRGHPETQGIHGRATGAVTCMEFDSQGWYLAVGGDSVTVYDFDRYLPKNLEVKKTFDSGVRAYLQPSDGIQTSRAVSCVRWNPADKEQLAVSYLNFDDVEVYDLQRFTTDGSVKPVLTLVPHKSSPSGGRGHLCLQFVRRGPPGEKIVHLVAGARGGVFRVWRLITVETDQLASATTISLSSCLHGQLRLRGAVSRADVRAVCCLKPSSVLVGTDSGLLAVYSLDPPVTKSFRSSKLADEIAGWSLRSPEAWGDDIDSVAPRDPASFAVQFLRLSLDHGAGVVLCGLRSGRVVLFDTTCGRALGITEPHRGASIGYCLPPAAAGVDVTPGEEAPLTEGEGAETPYGGGAWGPVVLTCCKSPEVGAREKLVVLATSARAALDSRKRRKDRGVERSARKSGMRPGPGWEVGEVGGGGFRVEESEGYDLCLPVQVVAATPGRSRVRLSKDVRGYLCPRAQGRLLRSRLVTSSIMIGKEEHSVEAVSADGTVLVLDRQYRGPAVVETAAAACEDGGTGARARARSATLPRRSPSSNRGGGGDVEADGDGSEVDDPENGSSGDDADGGRQSRTLAPSSPSASTTAGAVPSPVADRANAAADAAAAAAAAAGAGGDSDQPWDRAWRPNGVRVFAKLKAVFGDGQEQEYQDESVFCVRRPKAAEEAPAAPQFALYEVVARAELGLPVTAITSHPHSNFVLAGLSDGTVAAVLPQTSREEEEEIA